MNFYKRFHNILDEHVQKAIDRFLKENFGTEGGEYTVHSFADDDKHTANSSYKHLKNNNNVTINYTQVAKPMSDTPNGRKWVRVPEHMAKRIDKNKNYEIFKGEKKYNPRKPKSDDTFVKVPGGRKGSTYYMPAIQKLGNGDNVGIKVKKLTVYLPYTNEEATVTCYNTSSLGNTNSTATLLAHTYKGKPTNIGGEHSQVVDASLSGYTYNCNGVNKAIKKVPNFESGSLKTYMIETIREIQKCKRLYHFNPNYILYLESSSDFNLLIANLVKRFIFNHAQIVLDGGIKKNKSFNINYYDLICRYDKKIREDDDLNKRYSDKHFGNAGQTARNVIVGRTIEYIFVNSVVRFIARKLRDNLQKFYTQDAKGHFKPKNSFKETNQLVFDFIEDIFWEEFDKLDLAFDKWNYRQYRSQGGTGLYDYSDEEKGKLQHEHYNLEVENIFMKTLRIFYGAYGKKIKYTNTEFKNIANIFIDYNEIKKLLCGDNPPIYLKPEAIVDKTAENDQIHKFGKEERNVIDDQFYLDLDNNKELAAIFSKENRPCEKRYLVIDDNFSSGVSLRNACQLLINQRIPPENIIAMTPGDMGESGTGGAKGGAVPIQNAEASLLKDMGSGKNSYYGGYENNKDWEIDGKLATAREKSNSIYSSYDVFHAMTSGLRDNLYYGPLDRQYHGDNSFNKNNRKYYGIPNEREKEEK